MKIPGMPIKTLTPLNSATRLLQLVFKIGVVTAIAVILLGGGIGGAYSRENFGKRLTLGSTVAAEFLIAIACAALAVNAVIGCLVYIRGFAKSWRLAISGVIPYLVAAALMTGVSVSMIIFATRQL